MICDIIYHVVTGFSEEAGKEQPNLIHSDETCRKLSDWQISPCCTDVNSWWRRWVTLDVIALFERSIGTLPSSPFLPPPPSPSLSLFLYRFLSPFSLWFIYLCCRGPPPPPRALLFPLYRARLDARTRTPSAYLFPFASNTRLQALTRLNHQQALLRCNQRPLGVSFDFNR